MDCYQHIHPTHQSPYNNSVASGNHPYYPGNYGTASMKYAHAHVENGQQQNWIDGYSRFSQSQHHLSSHGNFSNSFNSHYGAMRENFHPSNEAREQFYYQTAHQASTSYYGNHSYDSYRNASSNYHHYHYGSGGSGGGVNYHQQASHPSQYYQPSYTEQFNNRYYPTPPPSAPPPQRDSYTLPHSADRAANYTPSFDSGSSNEKHIERLSNDVGKRNNQVESSPPSPLVAQNPTENVDINHKSENQQTKLEESSSSVNSAIVHEESSDKIKSECHGIKVEENLVSESKEQKHELDRFQVFHDHNNQNHQRQPSTECSSKTEGEQENSSINDTENSIATGKRHKKTHAFDSHSKAKKKFLFVSLPLSSFHFELKKLSINKRNLHSAWI